jgi:hypothetical protein
LDKKVIVDCHSPLLAKILEKEFSENLTSSRNAPILTDDPLLGERSILVSEFPVDFVDLNLKIDNFYRISEKESFRHSEMGIKIENATENFIQQLRGILVEK